MDINDLFRSFFGIPSQPRSDAPKDSLLGDDGEEPDGFDIQAFGNMDDIFRHFHGDMRQQMEEIQRQMDDLFKHFGPTEFPGTQIEGRELPQDNGKSLRDKMFKDGAPENERKLNEVVPRRNPDFHSPSIFERMFRLPDLAPKTPDLKVDVDLDKEVESGDLSKLFGNERSTRQGQPEFAPRSHATFRSVSIRKICKPDGTIEERKTTRDSAGNEETTVTRSHGDESHTVTTRKKTSGEEEVIENYNPHLQDVFPQFQNPDKPSLQNPESYNDNNFSLFRKFFGKDLFGPSK